VGVNAGDGERFFSVPSSRSVDVINIASTSNINHPGRWMFRVDHANVGERECEAEENANGNKCQLNSHCKIHCASDKSLPSNDT
jgi:hypothetical protein